MQRNSDFYREFFQDGQDKRAFQKAIFFEISNPFRFLFFHIPINLISPINLINLINLEKYDN